MRANEFEQSVEQIDNKLDQTVEWGSDDELFISSYLHGHVSLAVSHAELSQQKTLKQLDGIVSSSLDAAFANNELELVDQQKVTRLWSQLIDQASNDTVDNAS